MPKLLDRLFKGPQSPRAVQSTPDPELEQALEVANARADKLEAELAEERTELESSKAQVEQISTLMDDLAASRARAASAVSDLQAAKNEVEDMNHALAGQDADLKLALAQATGSFESKDRMFGAVKSAVDELTDCLAAASTSSGENSNASQAVATAAANALVEAAEVAKRASEIIDVSDAIRAVADRTRLLSLNAKIEASKAKEFGRGFSVVADEVGKLSGEASDASERIAEVAVAIEGATKNVQSMIESVRETTDEVKHSSESLITNTQRQEQAITQLLAQIEEAKRDQESLG
ncbi:MAG: hypothetical protein GY944_24240 [bacterium]|nr:hypothetical protein [bacterium]